MKNMKRVQRYAAMIMCYIYVLSLMIAAYAIKQRNNRNKMIQREIVSTSTRRRRQQEYLHRVVYESDIKCIDKLRMDRRCFHNLCALLTTTGGLRGNVNVGVQEMTAMFLNIIAHHVKNRIIKFDFVRSGETVSRHFHAVLKSVILCHGVLLKKPEPVPENSTDFRWKWFKGCLGALDGTHIRVNVPKADRPRYRSRKSEITTNVLCVCDQDMQFTYVLSGWEGSAHDGRVQTTLKAVPNIESRVKLFRNKTTAIADILKISGFVWNHERCAIDCDKSAYDEYVKAHKEAAGLYGKSFPFFNDLVQVFAKDRAQGTAGGDIGDDAEQYQHEDINLNDDRAFFETATGDFVMSTEEPIPTQSPMVSDAGTSNTRRKRKKATTDQSLDKLNDNLNNLAEVVGPGFQALADSANREDARETARIEAEKVARAERDEKIALLGEIIFEIDGLTDDEAMFILQELPNNDTQMKIFFNLPDNRKLRFCRVFLARSSFSPHG